MESSTHHAAPLYRGLVHKTAALVVRDRVPMEYDDIVQALWLKVLYALERYDPARTRQTRNGFVFMCLMDKRKDLRRKRRRPESYIEDLRLESQDGWDHRNGLALDHEAAFAEVEDEAVVLPATLTFDERSVIDLLTDGYRQAEAARHLGWNPSRMERTMRSIRLKLADWEPTGRSSTPPARVTADELELLLAA